MTKSYVLTQEEINDSILRQDLQIKKLRLYKHRINDYFLPFYKIDYYDLGPIPHKRQWKRKK